MNRLDCLRFLASLRRAEMVVCNLGGTSGEWSTACGEEDARTFYLRSAMGQVSSVALGLALAQPQLRFWAFDGDGSLALNLGALLTLGRQQPGNMIHFLWANGMYEATGGQPLPTAAEADFAGMAREAGVRRAFRVDDPDSFEAICTESAERAEFTFIQVDVEPMEDRVLPSYSMDPIEMTNRFARHLTAQIPEQD